MENCGGGALLAARSPRVVCLKVRVSYSGAVATALHYVRRSFSFFPFFALFESGRSPTTTQPPAGARFAAKLIRPQIHAPRVA